MFSEGLSEDEAISLMSVAVDFGVTQVGDGNWGVHEIGHLPAWGCPILFSAAAARLPRRGY
jgi:hypothetical protein